MLRPIQEFSAVAPSLDLPRKEKILFRKDEASLTENPADRAHSFDIPGLGFCAESLLTD